MTTDSDECVVEPTTNGTESVTHPSIWTDDRGRMYASDGHEIVHLHRLTAVAEHGIDAVADSDVHHAVSANADAEPVHIDVPEWLYPLDPSEHRRLHDDDEYVGIEGIEMIVPDDDRVDESADGEIKHQSLCGEVEIESVGDEGAC